MPTRRPPESSNAPPELPPLMGASVCKGIAGENQSDIGAYPTRPRQHATYDCLTCCGKGRVILLPQKGIYYSLS